MRPTKKSFLYPVPFSPRVGFLFLSFPFGLGFSPICSAGAVWVPFACLLQSSPFSPPNMGPECFLSQNFPRLSLIGRRLPSGFRHMRPLTLPSTLELPLGFLDPPLILLPIPGRPPPYAVRPPPQFSSQEAPDPSLFWQTNPYRLPSLELVRPCDAPRLAGTVSLFGSVGFRKHIPDQFDFFSSWRHFVHFFFLQPGTRPKLGAPLPKGLAPPPSMLFTFFFCPLRHVSCGTFPCSKVIPCWTACRPFVSFALPFPCYTPNQIFPTPLPAKCPKFFSTLQAPLFDWLFFLAVLAYPLLSGPPPPPPRKTHFFESSISPGRGH